MGKTKTIIVIEPIQITQFFMPKIGVEKVVNDGEDYLEVYKEARKEIELMARQGYPNHFEEPPIFATNHSPNEKTNGNEQPEDNFSLLDEINKAENSKELKAWHILVRAEKNHERKTELQVAYSKKMNELTQKETV